MATTYPAKTYWTSAPGSEVAASVRATKATDTTSAAKRNSALPTGLYHRRTRRDQLGRNNASSALCSRTAAVKTQGRPARFMCSLTYDMSGVRSMEGLGRILAGSET